MKKIGGDISRKCSVFLEVLINLILPELGFFTISPSVPLIHFINNVQIIEVLFIIDID